jgi:predicted nucleic acid-binding Zn ribbon protein
MPTYEFKDKETGESQELFMKISEKEKFLKDNPNLIPIISAANFITRTDGDVLKTAGDGWKEVQDKIKSGLPPKYAKNINTK